MAIDGEVVATLRKLKGMKVPELAEKVGLKESYIRDIESGARRLVRDDRNKIPLIAEALGVPVRAITIAE